MTDKLKQFLPADVNNSDEIDQLFTAELLQVSNEEHFRRFLYKWEYWLDKETRKLKGSDWGMVNEFLIKLRTEKTITKEMMTDSKYLKALRLAVPSKIVLVSYQAKRFRVSWGFCYHQLRKAKAIKF